MSYLLGVKISDLPLFTMSQTLVDYQRPVPSWYVFRLFFANKIPEISITYYYYSIKELLFLEFSVCF